uniref:Uncharacterized protein n=1 Tax=Cacopsylla melanoneura TaxID=428564 RepID=A0A8D8SJ99_9HEMI
MCFTWVSLQIHLSFFFFISSTITSDFPWQHSWLHWFALLLNALQSLIFTHFLLFKFTVISVLFKYSSELCCSNLFFCFRLSFFAIFPPSYELHSSDSSSSSSLDEVINFLFFLPCFFFLSRAISCLDFLPSMEISSLIST